ncbi:hypothetical protein ESCO_004799 [Escovopsis weberi]|uniref:Uncharacterized protein n=1 Tax=Escovopsis weberi TaxID=150374 RepID=A0A0M8MZC4_ESCWE|nr:hypothetical protein ESCO_004799 [Escovopsis weberi]
MPRPQPPEHNNDPHFSDSRQRSSSGTLSSTSESSSSSYLDISRKYPTDRFGGFLRTFIRAPSERVRRRRRSGGSSRRRRRVGLLGGNSSSSSIDDDMAYGTGFLRKPKSRSYSFRGDDSQFNGEASASSSGHRREGKRAQQADTTDDEILALGQRISGMAKLSSDELRLQRRGSKSSRRSKMSRKGKCKHPSHFYNQHGSGSAEVTTQSRVRIERRGADDEGWESASDDDSSFDSDTFSSSSDDACSGLAYPRRDSTPPHRSDTAAAATTAAAAAAAAAAMTSTSAHTAHSTSTTTTVEANETHSSSFFGRLFGGGGGGGGGAGVQHSRKPSVVDPKLFGPVNSLRGHVSTPCGFDDRQEMVHDVVGEEIAMRRRHPITTADPHVFDADASTTVTTTRVDSHRVNSFDQTARMGSDRMEPSRYDARDDVARMRTSPVAPNPVPNPRPCSTLGRARAPASTLHEASRFDSRFESSQNEFARFDSRFGSTQSQRLANSPIPLQQPVPKPAVPQNVYRTERLESLERRGSEERRRMSEDIGKLPSSIVSTPSPFTGGNPILGAPLRVRSTERYQHKEGGYVDPRDFRDAYKLNRHDTQEHTEQWEKESDHELSVDKERERPGPSPKVSYYQKYTDDSYQKRQSPHRFSNRQSPSQRPDALRQSDHRDHRYRRYRRRRCHCHFYHHGNDSRLDDLSRFHDHRLQIRLRGSSDRDLKRNP